MSRFLYYFEDKNKDSVFYDGFAEVGNFIIPDSINQGYKDFSFDSKILKVGIIASGYSANPFFQAKENEKLILQAIKSATSGKLKEVKESLPENITYLEIRAVYAKHFG